MKTILIYGLKSNTIVYLMLTGWELILYNIKYKYNKYLEIIVAFYYLTHNIL